MTRFGVDIIRKRAAQAVNAEGLRPFARRSGVAVGVVRSLIDNRDPSFSNAVSMATALGLEFHIGPPREQVVEETLVLNAEDYAPIPLHEVELAAGVGAANGDEAIVGHLAFRKDWLRKIDVTPSNARLARVIGESMLPTLSPGDMVMIDITRTTVPVRRRQLEKPLRADLYAVIDNGGARVKRIEHSTPGELWLHSDNTSLRLPPEKRTGFDAEQLGIIGKVVWWGHTVDVKIG